MQQLSLRRVRHEAGGCARHVAVHGRRLRLRAAPAVSGGAGGARGARAAALGARRADAAADVCAGLPARDDPAHRARRKCRRNARRDHARRDHRDLAIRGLPSPGDRLVRPALQVRQREVRAQARAARSPDLVRHARAERRDRRLCARMRHGRACGRAQARSARASPAVLFGSRPARRPALQQQGAARMLPPGRGGVRLGQAQSRAALDARRQRPGRLGHGDRRLGGAAGADHGAHRAHRQRPCRGRVRDLRHRHRHLHHHGAGRGRHARAAARQHQHQARRLEPAAIAGRRRIVDCGLGGERDRDDGGRDPRRAAAPGQADAELAARERRARRRRACGRQAREQARCLARGVDRRCHAARRRGPHRAGEDHQPRRRSLTRAQRAFGGLCRGEGGRAARRDPRHARRQRGRGRTHPEHQDRGQPDPRRRGLGHRHGAARGNADRSPASAAS